MKNAIMYYYNLIPTSIHLTNDYIRFNVNDESYMLEVYKRNADEIQDLYNLSLYLLQYNVLCHQIIPNKSNQLITFINNIPYVLLKVFVDNKQLIRQEDLLTFQNIIIDENKFKSIKRNNWLDLWTTKIDYLEYQVSEFGKKYSIIRDSFSYYIGLAENAIQFLKTINKRVPLCIAHRRIKKDYTMYDLYNPLEFIIDTRIRDYSEYFKQIFLEENIDLENIKTYIYNNNLMEFEIKLLFCRMLFPTTYFDVYEDIVIDSADESLLLPIINKSNEYESLLKKIYLFLFNYSYTEVIEWLNISI